MMKLSTMKKVVDTVDQDWRSPLAEQILENWGYDEGSVYYFRASANFVFIYKNKGKTFFLRFTDSKEKDIGSLESEIAVLEYLRTQPVRVALPVKSLNQKYIESVDTEIGTFYAVVFEALPGEQYDTEELNTDQFFTWGRALGGLHESFKSIPDTLKKKRRSWRDQLSRVREIISDNETHALKELAEITKWSEQLSIDELSIGLIHYDFELDNQRWENEIVGILDFDDCLNHWYVADIVFALRDVFQNGVDLKDQRFKQFLKGYASKTQVNTNLLQELSFFLRMHELVLFATLLRTVDLPDSVDHPEWLSNLRLKLLAYIERYRAQFVQYSERS